MMFPAFSNGTWTNEAWTAALVNHLWQSTVVVLIAWLLTLILRNNHAAAFVCSGVDHSSPVFGLSGAVPPPDKVFPRRYRASLTAGWRRNRTFLHSMDHRLAMICSGRDDRVEKIGTSPTQTE
jgi:hypothetical protein